MIKTEYKVIEVSEAEELEITLNALSANGWKLVGIPFARAMNVWDYDSEESVRESFLVAILENEYYG